MDGFCPVFQFTFLNMFIQRFFRCALALLFCGIYFQLNNSPSVVYLLIKKLHWGFFVYFWNMLRDQTKTCLFCQMRKAQHVRSKLGLSKKYRILLALKKRAAETWVSRGSFPQSESTPHCILSRKYLQGHGVMKQGANGTSLFSFKGHRRSLRQQRE